MRLLAFLMLTLVLGPIQFMTLPFARIRQIVPLVYHRTMLKLLGVRVRVFGPRPPAGTLLVSNHMSWFDIVVIGAVMPLSFVAKSEVKGWPLFGQLAHLQRTVFIERARARAALASRHALRQRLQAGDTLVLFAEGTSTDGLRVLPFRPMLFSAVTSNDDDKSSPLVQPMTLAYARVHNIAMGRRQRMAYAWIGDVNLLSHLWFIFSTPPLSVDLVFHPPLPPEAMADRKIMARESQRAVCAGLDAIFTGQLAEAERAQLAEVEKSR